MNSIQNYYLLNAGESVLPQFVAAFLSDINLAAIQTMLTQQLREATGFTMMPTVEWSTAITDALLAFADRYSTSPATHQVVAYANFGFADQMLSQNEARYYESAFWRRWCEQGVPDPNNIPLPLKSERTDFTVETSGYILSDPVGYMRFPTC